MRVDTKQYQGMWRVRCVIEDRDEPVIFGKHCDRDSDTYISSENWLCNTLARNIKGNGWQGGVLEPETKTVLYWPRLPASAKVASGVLIAGVKRDVVRLLRDEGFTVEVAK